MKMFFYLFRRVGIEARTCRIYRRTCCIILIVQYLENMYNVEYFIMRKVYFLKFNILHSNNKLLKLLFLMFNNIVNKMSTWNVACCILATLSLCPARACSACWGSRGGSVRCNSSPHNSNRDDTYNNKKIMKSWAGNVYCSPLKKLNNKFACNNIIFFLIIAYFSLAFIFFTYML